jgi:hypothetical protein
MRFCGIMIGILQLLGLLYLVLMLYLTFLYYKKNHYSWQSFTFWITVWSLGILLMLFPQTSSFITQRLTVPRVIDFYLIIGLMFFSIITFLNYVAMQRTQRKVEDLVRELARKKRK